MIAKLLATMLMALLAAQAPAADWYPVDSGVESTLNDLFFHDAASGVAVGHGGTILLTDDGGETWTAPETVPPGGADLHGVGFGDASRGVAVGTGGTVWWTADGARHWSAGASGTTENLFAVAMSGPLQGLAVGWNGTVLRTTDGGATWSALAGGTSQPLWGVAIPQEGVAVAVGDHTILRTADGGDSWTDVPHPMPGSWLYDVDFADAACGVAVGDYATVLRTADGGLTWTLEHGTDNDADFLLAVTMRDSARALAVGWIGAGPQNALRTVNGGRDWASEDTGYGSSLRSAACQEGWSIATAGQGLMFKVKDPVAASRVPRTLALFQNRPNPFNPRTTIAFEVADRRPVSLRVIDLSGRTVRSLLTAEPCEPGYHEVVWNGRDDAGAPAASGTYFYRLEAGPRRETKRMVLVK